MTALRPALDDYLATRRAMGYKLVVEGRILGQFVTHLEAVGAGHLTVADALVWAKQPAEAKQVWWAARLAAVRGFARYLRAIDPATEVPPVGLIPEPGHRAAPYIYSGEEIAALVQAAGRLSRPHRADTYQVLIGLLSVTGMRVGEVVRLDRADVDLRQGLLTVRNSKFGKSRQLPVHPTTVEALTDYARRRDERQPRPRSPSFFTSTTRTRLLRDNVSTVFPLLVRDAGISAPEGRRAPRTHDLRHTFAVRTLIDWYRQGVDVSPRLPVLSTYLGHVDPSTTYWYLTGVPELFGLITERMDSGLAVDR